MSTIRTYQICPKRRKRKYDTLSLVHANTMFMTSFRESADHVTTPRLWYRVEAEEKETNCAHACRDSLKAFHKNSHPRLVDAVS